MDDSDTYNQLCLLLMFSLEDSQSVNIYKH